MSGGSAPAQRPVMTITEMNGRLEELERQRDAALTRCATLAGVNALLRQTLTEARAEIERLPPPALHGISDFAMIAIAFEHAKTAAAALGVGGVLFSAYATSGLPVPASQAFVRAEVGVVVARIEASDRATAAKIDGLAVTTLELQRKGIVLSKARLRFELAANGSLLPKADPARRATLERRASEIADEIRDLDRDDANLRERIERLNTR